jgi:hypothetical protein
MELVIKETLDAVKEAALSLDFFGGMSILVYILQALALYTIAKRRSINKPWLAWIPLVNVWILGSVSDQYQYVVHGKVKNKRKILLGLNIAITALTILILAVFVWRIVELVLQGAFMLPHLDDVENIMENIPYQFFPEQVGTLILLSLAALPLSVLTIVHVVFFYMALYDVFCSCEPENSKLYICLSLVGNVVVDGVYALFLILCKDKELGMPPRKPEPEMAEEHPEERITEE